MYIVNTACMKYIYMYKYAFTNQEMKMTNRFESSDVIIYREISVNFPETS